MGGGGGGGGGGPGMGNFGHWDNSGMQGRMITEQHLVPANRTGLVIGKGMLNRGLLSCKCVLFYVC